MTKDEALKLALEALEYIEHNYMSLPKSGETAITAIREALAQPEQEPIAWADMDVRGEDKGLSWTPGYFHKTPLYTTPQPEQEPVAHTLNCVCGAVWDIKSDGSEEMAHTPDTTPPQRKPLTDEEIEFIYADTGYNDIQMFARAIEAAHGIKE